MGEISTATITEAAHQGIVEELTSRFQATETCLRAENSHLEDRLSKARKNILSLGSKLADHDIKSKQIEQTHKLSRQKMTLRIKNLERDHQQDLKAVEQLTAENDNATAKYEASYKSLTARLKGMQTGVQKRCKDTEEKLAATQQLLDESEGNMEKLANRVHTLEFMEKEYCSQAERLRLSKATSHQVSATPIRATRAVSAAPPQPRALSPALALGVSPEP